MISYIGLGSNLDEPLRQLQNALDILQQTPDIKLLRVSSFYNSKALTLPDSAAQNDYINAVARLQTTLSAQHLLEALNRIEASAGRERKKKWAARTLDLDILLYDGQQIHTETLVIPHLQLQYRNFVIHPLYEIAGDIDIPKLGKLTRLVSSTSWDGLQKIAPSLLEHNEL